MKKILLTGLAVGFCILSFSQETVNADKKPTRIKLVKGGESTTSSKTKEIKSTQTPAQELEKCEKNLIALQKKEDYIRSNAEELKLANENGWFKDAEKSRAVLNKRIAELKLELKK